MIAVQTPYTQFFATDGSPIDNGYLYIGLVSQNPETAPAQVFWDFAGTQPAAQPIRLLNGYPARDGTPTPVFTPEDYSFAVKDARGQIQYATNFSPSISTSASDVLGQLANQTNPALGAGLVGYKGKSVSNKLSEFISVKDFGATGDGTTDDTAAIQAALNSNTTAIFIPSGRYRVTSTLLRTGHTYLYGETMTSSVFIMEGSSIFAFDGGSAASEYNTFQLHIERLSFEAPTLTTKNVVSASWAAGIGGTSKTIIVRDVEVTGTNDTGGFGAAFYLKNSRNVVFQSARILGDRDASPISSIAGISIEGDALGAPVELFFTNVEIFFVKTAINIVGHVEGVYINNCTAIACGVGILATATLGPKPLLSVLGSHFNTDKFGIQTSGFVQANYAHNLIYFQLVDGTSTSYAGIQMDAGGASLDAQIMDNNFQGLGSGIAKNAIVVLNGTGSDNCIIGGNIISSYDTGVFIAPGATDAVILDTNTFKSCVQQVVANSGNRNCVASLVVGNSSKTHPDGLIEKFGETVLSLDASGNANIPLATAFPSTLLFATCSSGDATAGTGLSFLINSPTSTLSSLAFSARPNPGAITVRVAWLAKGF